MLNEGTANAQCNTYVMLNALKLYNINNNNNKY